MFDILKLINDFKIILFFIIGLSTNSNNLKIIKFYMAQLNKPIEFRF